MNPANLKAQKFWAGVMFVAFGLYAVLGARGIQMGTLQRMGPGYFPTVLGVGLLLVGLACILVALFYGDEQVERPSFRPMFFITVATLAGGYLIPRLGLPGAVLVLIGLGGLAAKDMHWDLKHIAFILVTVTLSALVFIYGLGLPLRVLGTWF